MGLVTQESWDTTPDASRTRDERPDESTPWHARPNDSDPERVSQVQRDRTDHFENGCPVPLHLANSAFYLARLPGWGRGLPTCNDSPRAARGSMDSAGR